MFRTLRFYHSFFKFLSTPSSRRATGAARHHATVPTYFYPRPPRGGRPLRPNVLKWSCRISIHALREEGDDNDVQYADGNNEFLSTPSARRATVIRMIADVFTLFLSTPSARRATVIRMIADVFTLFLSTPSARRATGYRSGVKHGKLISIHALREEGDTCGPSPLDNSI